MMLPGSEQWATSLGQVVKRYEDPGT